MSITEVEPAGASPRRGQLYEVECREVRIPTAEAGVTLAADLYAPIGAGAVPALVTALPYRKDGPLGIAFAPTMRWFAARGFAALLADFRGTGSSDGAQRAPFDAAEADDGVAAVEWAALQPWCTGNVGMWGHSYGAIMALRTAARRPSHLRAILPIMGVLDPERDLVHPGGQEGCFTAVAAWGLQTMLNQLLPPLEHYYTEAQQVRWRRRLHDSEPWLLDLFRHKPESNTWRLRTIDASAIDIPTFCIAGWRDWFCDATIRAYENVSGPKKLLVGPWGHTLPDVAPVAPIHYQALALQWWDHWLNGAANGVMDEPDVILFEQGSAGRWRAFSAWPISDSASHLTTSTALRLEPASDGEPVRREGAAVISEHVPDATVGALGGAWGATDRFGRPLDQHDDDMRSLLANSTTLSADVVIAGRPVVTVTAGEGTTVSRFVVRLADVDPDGRSIPISVGTASYVGSEEPCAVVLAPTCYRLPAGHRLRVALTDSDFPTLWPAAAHTEPKVLKLVHLELVLPIVPEGEGSAYEPPPSPGPDPSLIAFWVRQNNIASIARDHLNDSIELHHSTASAVYTRDRAQLLESEVDLKVRAINGSPGSMCVRGTASGKVRVPTGQMVVARAALSLTQLSIAATATIEIDGIETFSRRWSA